MKRLTMKWKIMLWYTTLNVLLLGVVLPFMYYTLSHNMYADARTLLQSDINRTIESLEFEGNAIKLDEDVDLVGTGTYVIIYSNNNQMLSGKLPRDFNLYAQPRFDSIYMSSGNHHQWLVYDYKLTLKGEKLGWLRAVKTLDSINKTLTNLRIIILVVIPIYIAIALFGGAIIARRSLSPIVKITKTAKQIGYHDLTKRIRYNGVKDEVGMLAETFDEMLDRLEDSLSREKRFTSDVSHELRTPTTVIMVSAEDALNGNKSIAEYQETITTIRKESRKMSSMISQLLMIARSNEGQYKHEMELINISLLTKTIIDELSESIEQTDITISADIEDGIIMFVEQTLYMRLLINLVNNAVKYNTTPEGWVKVSLSKEKDFIKLSVEDNGMGISKKDLPEIWNRFFKVDPSRLDSSPGLGLSIVKWIVELHGGRIQVKSEIGKGSLFEAYFPLNQKAINNGFKIS